jgi:hypothetical protein
VAMMAFFQERTFMAVLTVLQTEGAPVEGLIFIQYNFL